MIYPKKIKEALARVEERMTAAKKFKTVWSDEFLVIEAQQKLIHELSSYPLTIYPGHSLEAILQMRRDVDKLQKRFSQASKRAALSGERLGCDEF